MVEAVEFDLDAAKRSIEAVRPGMPVIEVSAKTGAGMEGWVAVLTALRSRPGAIETLY